MITSIVIGSGARRVKFDVPARDASKPGEWPNGRVRVGSQPARIAMGNKIKSGYLWPNGRGFRGAKARGERAVAGGMA